MKSKQLKYVLIVIVLLIWGFIVFKIFYFIKPKSDIVENSNERIIDISNDNNMDSFTISANYPDPFLKKSTGLYSVSNTSSVNRKPVSDKALPSATVKWPNINYTGYVSDNIGNKSSILLIVDGSGFILKKGDIVKEVEVLSITKDSIKVQYSGMSKYVKRYEHK